MMFQNRRELEKELLSAAGDMDGHLLCYPGTADSLGVVLVSERKLNRLTLAVCALLEAAEEEEPR